jgi:hypothetical protein
MSTEQVEHERATFPPQYAMSRFSDFYENRTTGERVVEPPAGPPESI